MRFFNPLAVAFAVDTVISVNRIFLSVTRGRKGRDGSSGLRRASPFNASLGNRVMRKLR
jgi:hypothetical protein